MKTWYDPQLGYINLIISKERYIQISIWLGHSKLVKTWYGLPLGQIDSDK